MKTAATLSITVPAVVMTIPLLDTALAILRRRLTGQPFHLPDRGHIHHRLLDRGLNTWQALCIIASLCLATGAAAAAATIFRSDALAWFVTLALVVLLVRLRTFGHQEISLVKVRAAGLLTRWGMWLGTSTRPAPRASRSSTSMTFQETWAALTAEAAQCHARRLQVTVENAGQRRGQRVWLAGEQPAGDSSWTISLTFGRAEATCCHLTAEGSDAGKESSWRLLRLAGLLDVCGRHWLAHPDEVPHVLPLERAA
jgi:hypothetical protein